jgi:hypothetical protein
VSSPTSAIVRVLFHSPTDSHAVTRPAIAVSWIAIHFLVGSGLFWELSWELCWPSM